MLLTQGFTCHNFCLTSNGLPLASQNVATKLRELQTYWFTFDFPLASHKGISKNSYLTFGHPK